MSLLCQTRAVFRSWRHWRSSNVQHFNKTPYFVFNRSRAGTSPVQPLFVPPTDYHLTGPGSFLLHGVVRLLERSSLAVNFADWIGKGQIIQLI